MRQQGVHPEDAGQHRGLVASGHRRQRPEGPGRGCGRAHHDGGRRTRSYTHGRAQKRLDPADDCGDEVHNDEVEGDEPLLPARVHRPSDLMRLMVGVLAIVVLLAVAAFAHGTTSGSNRTSTRAPASTPIR